MTLSRVSGGSDASRCAGESLFVNDFCFYHVGVTLSDGV